MHGAVSWIRSNRNINSLIWTNGIWMYSVMVPGCIVYIYTNPNVSNHNIQNCTDVSHFTNPFNPLWHNDINSSISFGSGNSLACCLTAPTHYLNQFWLIISATQWQSTAGHFTIDATVINHQNYIESLLPTITLKSPSGHWVSQTRLVPIRVW